MINVALISTNTLISLYPPYNAYGFVNLLRALSSA